MQAGDAREGDVGGEARLETRLVACSRAGKKHEDKTEASWNEARDTRPLAL